MDTKALWDLTGKVAIVTGGSNGIGRASCEALADVGAKVVIADIDLKGAESLAQELIAKGHEAIAVSCNILDDEEMVACVDRTVQTFGTVNILVNVAGGGAGGREDPYKITVKDFERDFQLNVFSAWRMIQLCAPHMEKSGYGSIINITSMGAITNSPKMSGYASSKAALVHMGSNLAFDYGPANIRINAVGPGATRTHSLATVLTPEIEAKMLARTPLKRLGTPEDIAGAVLYFACPISSWVDGQVLFVNGGGIQTLD